MLLSLRSFGKLHTSFKSTTNAKITILQIIIRNINISVGHNLSKITCIISFIHYTLAVKISFKLLLWATNSEEFFCLRYDIPCSCQVFLSNLDLVLLSFDSFELFELFCYEFPLEYKIIKDLFASKHRVIKIKPLRLNSYGIRP